MTARPVLVSQRADHVVDRGEWRDALDRRVPRVLARLGLVAVAVPNVPESVEDVWLRTRPEGLVLSGGNDLVDYGGDSPERDLTETLLLERAIADGVPVLGICRGAQLIATYFGSRLVSCAGHVGTRHEVHGEWGSFVTNSFHRLAPTVAGSPLRPTMWSADGQVEALEHEHLPVLGIMWHPEREQTLAAHDRELIERQFRVRDTLVAR